MKIDKRILPAQPAAGAMATRHIPALIHQTFETNEVAPGMHAAAMSWTALNPGYEYRFYDNDDRRQTIATQFGSEVLEAYDHIENGAFRADLWRYCQLFVDGGIYIDLDSVCEMPLDELLDDEDSFVSARAGNLAHAVYNGFICTAPGHPVLKAAIDRAVRLILDNPRDFDGYMTTGPWTLGVAVNTCLGRAETDDQILGLSEANSLRIRLLQKHPRSPEHSGHLSDGTRTVLLTEYPEYREDLESIGITHWQDNMRAASFPTRLRRKIGRVLKRLTGRRGH